MIVRALSVLLLILLPLQALAQGFAGLGSAAQGFDLPQRGTELHFPHDHGPHPTYRIEWWYLTATLRGADGQQYGVQWTLFRSALAPETSPGWGDPQLWMGHAGLTTAQRHFHAERIARGGTGQAGVTATPFEAWIDDWQMQSVAKPGTDALSALSLRARARDFAYDLQLSATGPLVFHGDRGYSVKSPDGQASYYYSQPFYTVSGTLSLHAGPVEVTGQAWLDREWSSQPLSEDQRGWDWVSLSFDSGARLMGFRVRGAKGDFLSGSWIAPDGTLTALPPDALTLTPLRQSRVAGRRLPTRWALRYPAQEVDITFEALNPHSWMGTSLPYWEGPVQISGSHSGTGYLEMTGYE